MSKITATCPHFLVSDLQTSIDYYVEVLGFNRPELWGDPPRFAMPQLGGFTVMLNQVDHRSPRPNGNGIWDAYFWCDDVDSLYSTFESRRATIEHTPENRPLYGMREFAIRDPDDHILVFGSDLPS